MKKSVNQILKEQFIKDFNNNKKVVEAEYQQNPFHYLLPSDAAILDKKELESKLILVCLS